MFSCINISAIALIVVVSILSSLLTVPSTRIVSSVALLAPGATFTNLSSIVTHLNDVVTCLRLVHHTKKQYAMMCDELW